MSNATREEVEGTITQILFREWDPMGVHDNPAHANEYAKFAHDIYGLLIRGGSDVQVGRLLHKIEREDMMHEDADSRDLTGVLRTLRVLEKTM
jgi:hypothetical protein